MLQAHVGALEARLRKLEIQFAGFSAAQGDEAEAQRVAQELGFEVAILRDKTRRRKRDRRRLMEALRKKAWSADRIGRVMNCAGRSVERNFSRR